MFLPSLIFLAVIVTALWIDLRQHRTDKPISLRDAAVWSVIWVGVSLAFAGYVGVTQGHDKALLFTAGYLLEKSLSVDNLFVFMAVFASFGIRDGMQHRVLYYGILGALVLRLLFITFGSVLLMAGALSPKIHAFVYSIFGAVVLLSAFKMMGGGGDDDEEAVDYTNHWSVRWGKHFMPVTTRLYDNSFFVKIGHPYTMQGPFIRHATPLFLCLLAIETTDVAFAFDSVPVVIAVTKEPFLIYTSNIFAILGLRSMYFLLSAAKRYLCHLEKAIIAVLFFIGGKLLLEAFSEPLSSLVGMELRIAPSVSLIVVAVALALGVIGSLVFPEREEASS